MHYTHAFLFLSLFSSAAIAKNGWMGSFVTPDCTGAVMAGDAKNLDAGNCYKWTPSTDPKANNVGINFGSGYGQGMSAVRFYADDHCGRSNKANDYFHQASNGEGLVCLTRQQVLPYKSFQPLDDPYWRQQFNDH